MRKLIFGCGYLGCRVAELWQEDGAEVVVVSRSEEKAEGFRMHGYETVVADVTRPETLVDLPAADTVLFAVGYDRTAGPSIGEVYTDGARNVLQALPATTKRFIYISTTGVYGSSDGDWVDEKTPPDPKRDGGRASLGAEQALSSHPLGRNSAILRLAGIYGPGRIPYLEKLKNAEPLQVPSAGWLNLIHVDDGAAIAVAVDQWLIGQDNHGPKLFCVSDGNPVARGNYYREVARLIDAEPPQFVEPNPDSPVAQRAGVNRRISNDKLLSQLDLQLIYPSYREGLAAILR